MMKWALALLITFSALPAFAQEHEDDAHEIAPHDGHQEPGADDPGAQHAAGHHEVHVDWKLFGFSIINFLIWLAIIVVLLRKPLVSFLQNRRVVIVEGLEESKRLKDAAEAKFADYSERLAHLDEELAKLRKEMIQAGEAERDRIIAEAESKAARMRRDAQFLIDQQMKQLRVDLTREAIEAAVAAAEDMLRKEAAGGDQQRLADDYLKRLVQEVRA
jgi:F-type H+-transporting ATPase subunit b